MKFRALALAAAASVLCHLIQAAELTEQEKGWIGKGERHEKAGWIYLHIEGEPFERGFQHGYLLAHEISAAMAAYAAQWHHDSSFNWPWLVAHTRGFIEAGIDPEDRDEMKGIVWGMAAAGVKTSYSHLVAYNAFYELAWYWWPIAQKKMTDGMDHVEAPKQSCSSFIATGRMTRDGKIVLGHTNWIDYTLATVNVVLDVLPAKGHRILMQTSPGWIHSGTDFFVTDAGLVGSETTMGGFQRYAAAGIPEFVRMRRASQDAGSIDGWCAILRKGNNGGYANAWLLGDIRTGEIARLELGLNYVGFDHATDGYFVGSNVAENLGILRMETNVNDGDIRNPNIARRVRWKQLMRENAGRIDVEVAERMLGDCHDVCLDLDRGSSRTLAGHHESDPSPWGAPGDTWAVPFFPAGSNDAKVVSADMAARMRIAARWGSADGVAFDARAFLAAHPQFDWMEGILKSRPAEPWVSFAAGEKR